MTSTSGNRTDRISLRIASDRRHVIERAAEVTGKTLTSFVLDAAYQEAQRTLTDPRAFVVNDEQWAAFMEALDRPVSPDKPRLDKLMSTPSVLE